MKNITVSIILDQRRIKQNGKYPVKLSVFYSIQRKRKLYATDYEFTVDEFKSIWGAVKPREKHKPNRKKLKAIRKEAKKTIKQLNKFSFEAFENAFFDTHTDDDYSDVFKVFDISINKNIRLGAISTAEKYEYAKKSIIEFLKYEDSETDNLSFDRITVKFLEDYQYYCENIKGNSVATIGINLRNLRAVYRIAIKMGTASLDTYPFFKESFTIPTSKKVNKALTETELKLLWNTQPQTDKQAFAKDFWFFSYYAYGMNMRDICELKHLSIDEDSFSYVRAKTKNTKKERKEKQVPINNSLKQIIERRKAPNSEYLFGVIKKEDSPKQINEKIKRFTKNINQDFREFAIHAGINEHFAKQIGTYHARHSFATISIRKGTSFALISEILHDGNLKVTENYINSFPKDDYKKLSHDMEL